MVKDCKLHIHHKGRKYSSQYLSREEADHHINRITGSGLNIQNKRQQTKIYTSSNYRPLNRIQIIDQANEYAEQAIPIAEELNQQIIADFDARIIHIRNRVVSYNDLLRHYRFLIDFYEQNAKYRSYEFLMNAKYPPSLKESLKIAFLNIQTIDGIVYNDDFGGLVSAPILCDLTNEFDDFAESHELTDGTDYLEFLQDLFHDEFTNRYGVNA